MLLLVGKTCSGKDTIMRELIKKGMQPIVTYTTRPMRYDEIDGVSYHFISNSEFLYKRNNGFFAETTAYKVACGDVWYYGTAIDDLDDNKVLIVNPEGLKKLKRIESINAVSFYIMAHDETIKDRLLKRGDDQSEAVRRLSADNDDFNGIESDIDFAFRNADSIKPETLASMILFTYRKVIGEK